MDSTSQESNRQSSDRKTTTDRSSKVAVTVVLCGKVYRTGVPSCQVLPTQKRFHTGVSFVIKNDHEICSYQDDDEIAPTSLNTEGDIKDSLGPKMSFYFNRLPSSAAAALCPSGLSPQS